MHSRGELFISVVFINLEELHPNVETHGHFRPNDLADLRPVESCTRSRTIRAGRKRALISSYTSEPTSSRRIGWQRRPSRV